MIRGLQLRQTHLCTFAVQCYCWRAILTVLPLDIGGDADARLETRVAAVAALLPGRPSPCGGHASATAAIAAPDAAIAQPHVSALRRSGGDAERDARPGLPPPAPLVSAPAPLVSEPVPRIPGRPEAPPP